MLGPVTESMLATTFVTYALFAALLWMFPLIVCASSPGNMFEMVLVWATDRFAAPAEVAPVPVPEPLVDQYATATPPAVRARMVPPATAIFLLFLRMRNSPVVVDDP